MSYFVEPETDKIFPFENTDHWVEVKKVLNAGEERRIATTMFPGARQMRNKDGENEVAYEVDLDSAGFVKVVMYIVDWNVPRKDGKVPPMGSMRQRFDALKALHPDAYRRIEKTLDAFIERQEQEKNAQSVSSGSGTSSGPGNSPAGATQI